MKRHGIRRETIYYRYAEEYLGNYHQLAASIINNKKAIELILDTIIPSCTANYNLEEGGGRSGISDPTLQWTIQREWAAKNNPEIIERRNQIKEAEMILAAISTSMQRLSERQLTLINKRYFDNKSWDEISQEVNLSVNRCLEWKKRAVKKIAIGLYGPKAIGIHGVKRTK